MTNKAEKRSVSTDALETLGSIIGDGEKRDAIHIAVEPAVAAARLKPGQDVGFVDGGFATTRQNVGIVDPFLKQDVQQGERFWLLIYPRQITSLRHVWSHPDFPEAEVYAEPQKTDRSASEEWMRDFVDRQDSSISYEDMVAVASRYEGCGDSLRFGDEIYGDIPDEFWDHIEILTGKKFVSRATYFSCAC